MPDAANLALAESVSSVLEQMFFVTPLESPQPDEAAPAPLTARVCFSGAAAGASFIVTVCRRGVPMSPRAWHAVQFRAAGAPWWHD